MKEQQQNLMDQYESQEDRLFVSNLKKKLKKLKNKNFKSKKQTHSSIQSEVIFKKQLSQQKYHLIKDLMHLLGLQKSKTTFKQQRQDLKRFKNPQEYSNNKANRNNNKKLTNNHLTQQQLKHIISNSNNVQDILNTIQYFQNQTQNQVSLESTQFGLKKAQKVIGMLFPIEQHATIPIYKNIAINCVKRLALMLDTNQQDTFVILDDDNYLHILTSQTDKRSLKIQDKCKILLLRWLSKQLLLLINTNNKLYFYNQKLQLLRIYKLQINVIQSIHFHWIKNPYLKQKEQPDTRLYLKLFIINQKHKLIVNKICISNQSPLFFKPEIYDCYYSLNNIEILMVNKNQIKQGYSLKGNYHFFDNSLVEHYYGLTTNRRVIVKFDTVVKQSGVVWELDQSSRIQSMKSSQTRQFLILLISKRSTELFPLFNPQAINKPSQLIKYQIVKLNAHCSIIEKFHLNFQNQQLYKQIGCKKEFKINEMFILSPDWLSCFAIQNKIVYFSNQSGKLLYIHEIQQKNIKILNVKHNNTLIYTFDNHIKLLSLKQSDKTQFFITSKENHSNQRSGLMFRLSRYGIPETLLNLLRELRSNHIQLIEMP